MKYRAYALGADAELSVEREGLAIGGRFIDFAEFKAITPLSHRVIVGLLSDEEIEILGGTFARLCRKKP